LKLSDISKDQQIVLLAREAVKKVLEEDPMRMMKKKLEEIIARKGGWSRIS
jgi:hypothetical protein